MDQEHMLQRMRRAAEEWGRQRWGRPVVVQSCGEPCRAEDGCTTCEVELQLAPPSDSSKRRKARGQSARCLVTLEPDGSLGCFSRDELA
jgi:hypothetical protein